MLVSRGLAATVPGVVLAATVSLAARSYSPLDVTIGRTAGKDLLGGDLAVYSHHPQAQMGPLALALTGGLPRPLFVLLVCVLLGVFLALAHRLGASPRQVLGGGLLLGVPWAHLAVTGHVDDVLVLLGAGVVVAGLRERRDWVVVAGFALAMSGKPTAALLVGLLVLAGGRAVAGGLAVAAVLWLPFVAADPAGFLAAGHGVALVQPWSGPFMLGANVGDTFPGWVRPLQLGGGALLCFLVARRRGPAAGLVVALVVRVALEPGAWPAYSTSVIAAAILLPGVWRIRGALLAAVSWVVACRFPLDAGEGVLRMATLVGVALVAALVGDAEPSRESSWDAPGSAQRGLLRVD